VYDSPRPNRRMSGFMCAQQWMQQIKGAPLSLYRLDENPSNVQLDSTQGEL
jgi:hypothetical protein